MAEATSVCQSTICRIRRGFGPKPHRTETFRLSNAPFFIDKVRDVVGLCIKPPEQALVLCIDEKSQVQALEHTQPLLPLQPGQTERRTHDYVRTRITDKVSGTETHDRFLIPLGAPWSRCDTTEAAIETIAVAIQEYLEAEVESAEGAEVREIEVSV